MKIAVCSISKNEVQFMERWYNSAKDADYIQILDTGSTDKTVEVARSLGIKVYEHTFSPWRFDVARNLCLDLIPCDIDWVINLDVDEVLTKGWRERLDKDLTNREWHENRFRYNYIWSWKEWGVTPDLQYHGDKIHRRHTHYWKHPVHEVLTAKTAEGQVFASDGAALIEHYPDRTKSRGQYFGLLEMACREDPTDDRNSHYYGRELYYHKRWDAAIAEFKRHLSLPRAQWKAERAQSIRYMAQCYEGKGENTKAYEAYENAIAEDPMSREAHYYFADFLYRYQIWPRLLEVCEKALPIPDHPGVYLRESIAWGANLHILACVASWNCNKPERAMFHITNALSVEPDNELAKKNYQFMRDWWDDYNAKQVTRKTES